VLLRLLLAAVLMWILNPAAHVLLPMTVTVMFGSVLVPLGDVFSRAGTPPILIALAVMLIVLSSLVGDRVAFYPIVWEVMQRVPLIWLCALLGGLIALQVLGWFRQILEALTSVALAADRGLAVVEPPKEVRYGAAA
jgi:hypothetical protein